MCARGEEALRAAVDAISTGTGAQVLGIAADISRAEEVNRVVSAANDRFGRVDILVTNAGGPPSGSFESLGPDLWDDAVRLTLLSTVNFCRAVLPGMKRQRWGRIINITSITVKQPV